mmetsp:Transcript_105434/g.183376  ORF Transcript_105434/g.183376 Transcript_105434/m.183376 type:complete len:127 (+) Transcript_105434:78-458(+)
MAPKSIIDRVGEKNFTLEDFQERISDEESNMLHIVDVYTGWCGPCNALVPTLQGLQLKVESFEDRCSFTQVDRKLYPEYAERFSETSKPRFLFYKAGQEVAFIEGVKGPALLQTIQENLHPLTDED